MAVPISLSERPSATPICKIRVQTRRVSRLVSGIAAPKNKKIERENKKRKMREQE